MTARPPTVVDYGAFQQPPSRSLPRLPHRATAACRPFYDGGRWDLDALAAAARTGRCALAAAAAGAWPRRWSRQQEAAGRRRRPRGAPAARRPASRRRRHRPAGGPLRRPALTSSTRRSAALKVAAGARGAARRARGARLLGRLRRPRLRGGPLHHACSTRRARSARCATRRAREPAGQPASAHRARRHDHRRSWTSWAARCPPGSHRDSAARAAGASVTGPASRSPTRSPRLLSALLPDLVVLDPSDPALKALMASRCSRASCARRSPTSRLAARGRASSCWPPATTSRCRCAPGFLNLFLCMEGERRALAPSRTASIEVRGLGRHDPGRRRPCGMLRGRPGAPGARACCCGRWPRTSCCPPPPTSAARPRSRTTRRSAPPTRTSASRGPALVPRPEPHPGGAGAGARARGRGPHAARPAGRPRGPARALGARGLPRGGGGLRAHARGARARDGARSRRRSARSTRRCARRPTRARGRALHQIETLHEKATRALKKRDQTRADRLRRTRDALLPGGVVPGARAGARQPRSPATATAVVGDDLRERMDPWARGPPGDPPVNIGITCYPTVGGSGAVAAELGKQLARRGHSVHFVSYRLPFRLDDFQREHPLPRGRRLHATASSSTRPTTSRWPRRWRRSAREHTLDLFHVHYAIPHAITGFLAQQMLGRQGAQARSPRCTAPTSRSWARTARSSRSRASASSARDGVTAVSEFLKRMTVDEFEVGEPHRGHPELRGPVRVLRRARVQGPLRLRAPRARRSCSTSPTSGP